MVKQHFRKQFWISFGIIVASIAVAAGVLYYLSGDLSSQAATIALDRGEVQEKTDAVANLVSLESAAPQAAAYQAAMDQVLPDQYGLVTFTQWLSALGAKYGVTTDAVFQGSVVPPAGTTPGTAQFSFSAQGAPTDLTGFLDGMNERASGFLVSLSSFDVTNDGTNESMTGQGTLFFR